MPQPSTKGQQSIKSFLSINPGTVKGNPSGTTGQVKRPVASVAPMSVEDLTASPPVKKKFKFKARR